MLIGILWNGNLRRDLFSRTNIDKDFIIKVDETPIFFTPQISGVIAPKGAILLSLKLKDKKT